MTIGIDARAACGEKTGKGWYTYNLIREFSKDSSREDFLLYINKKNTQRNFPIRTFQLPSILWHGAVTRDWRRRASAQDVFFAPTSYIIPALFPAECPSVITVHDLVVFLYPAKHQAKATILERIFLPLALKKTKAVITPSENTKKDLMRFFPHAENKIHVIPLGVDEAFFKKETRDILNAVKEKYELPEKFILAVATIEPRKNIGRLLTAYEAIHKNHKNVGLVIIGSKGWKSEKVMRKLQTHDRVRHITNVAPEELRAIYQLAALFVFPSLYEGFGLPPLEAMASGLAVICSNRASLPNVCADAALYINPENTEEIAGTMSEVLKNEKLRRAMAEKGVAQARKFSWQKTAQMTLDVLHMLKCAQ